MGVKNSIRVFFWNLEEVLQVLQVLVYFTCLLIDHWIALVLDTYLVHSHTTATHRKAEEGRNKSREFCGCA